MTRSLLLTAFDDYMAPLGDLTAPLMLSYASKHCMDFRCVRQFPTGKPAYWHKIPCILEAFDGGYEKILYLDADQKITNPDIIPPGEFGFNASLDWGADAYDASFFSMAGFTAFRDSISFFGWLQDHESEWIDKPFPEQEPFRFLYRTFPIIQEKMCIHARRAFNSVPIQVHESVAEPWQDGDFAAHITMLPMSDRVKLFHEI